MVLLRLDGGLDGIEHFLGCLLAVQGNGTVIDEGLESLPDFTLKSHFELPPASLAVISFFGIDIKGLQVVNCSCIEHSQSSDCWGVEIKLQGFPA